MAGVLAFTLGLENAEFIEKLGISERVMVSLEVGVEALKTIFEKCWQAIEKGAALQALHARTGESVAGLYQLQEAFKAVEIDAGAVGGMLFKTEKFLGGITEEGEKTDEILARLGLTLDGLRKLDPGKTFGVVAAELHKLDAATAANIAGKLYGREGAGNMIQIANSAHEFQKAMELSAKDAKIWDGAAHAFHEIAMYAGLISGHIATFWAGLASGAASAILKVEKALEKIDFGAIGKKFGQVIDSFANIILAGQLSKVISLAISTGIQEGINFAMASVAGLDAYFNQVAINFGLALSGHITHGVIKGFADAAKLAATVGLAASRALGNKGAQVIPGQGPHRGDGYGDVIVAFATAFSAVVKTMPHDQAKALSEMLSKYQTVSLPPKHEEVKKAAEQSTNTEHDKPRFTDLEKIGFVIASGGTRNDHGKETVNVLKDIRKELLAHNVWGRKIVTTIADGSAMANQA